MLLKCKILFWSDFCENKIIVKVSSERFMNIFEKLINLTVRKNSKNLKALFRKT